MEKDLIEFYNFAKRVCISEGFKEEIQLVEERKFDQMVSEDFFREYVFVVCNSGMKNQVATKIFRKYFEIGIDAINHPGKKKAIKKAELEHSTWFMILKDRKTDKERLELLEKTPFIGKITKYHLARNLGIDCAKPDRHLKRVAWIFGYTDIIGCKLMYKVQDMCKIISERTGDRIGTVDVILWRYCILQPQTIEKLILDEIAERIEPAHTVYVIRNRPSYSLKDALKHPSPINAEIVKYVDGVRTEYIEYNTLTEKMYKPIKSLSFLKKGGIKQ